jgi:hypothetical protein
LASFLAAAGTVAIPEDSLIFGTPGWRVIHVQDTTIGHDLYVTIDTGTSTP